MSCAAPEQGPGDVPVLPGQTVIAGRVAGGAGPVDGAYVRLLDAAGEFTAEVVTAGGGHYRFYAAPGEWTVRALARGGTGEARVAAATGLNAVDLTLA